MPKLRGATFRTAVIERYRRRETSVEEAIVEMYLAGVSTKRIEDVSELCVSSRGFEQKEHRKLNSLSIGSAHAF